MNTTKITREEALRRWNASKETKRKMVEKLETLVRNSCLERTGKCNLFDYHTSIPIGSLPVRSRQLFLTKVSSFSTILRLVSLEAFQRRNASSLVIFVVFILYSSFF